MVFYKFVGQTHLKDLEENVNHDQRLHPRLAIFITGTFANFDMRSFDAAIFRLKIGWIKFLKNSRFEMDHSKQIFEIS
uniref:Uncharacterized protein n=1 Tax=Panagrolaimus sp. JU765 TaxID=591449 RepID=A0AC34QVY1_9BILA